jgi:hypothetical protein
MASLIIIIYYNNYKDSNYNIFYIKYNIKI